MTSRTTTSLGGVSRPEHLAWPAWSKRWRAAGYAWHVRFMDRAGATQWAIVDGYVARASTVSPDERNGKA